MPKRPYDSRHWRRLRLTILRRDHYICQIQYPGICTTVAATVDHITPWTRGGAWYDPNNLRAACQPCNTTRNHQPDPHQPEYTPSRTWL